MNSDHIPILDAALDVFVRYGFKRTKMGDIAEAAGLSRQSLYARFANKDEVYAAGLDLYGARTIDALKTAWAKSDDLGVQLDAFAQISIIPTYKMLRQNPNAADLIEAAATPGGKAAMERVTALKCADLADILAPYADALQTHGQTPAQIADFVDATKQAIIHTARDEAHLMTQVATLKAAVLSLTS